MKNIFSGQLWLFLMLAAIAIIIYGFYCMEIFANTNSKATENLAIIILFIGTLLFIFSANRQASQK
jgi:hypothetical protein